MAEEIVAPPVVDGELHRTVKASYEEYLALPHAGRLIEWVDGEAIYHMPPTPLHQRLVRFLTILLGQFVDLFSLGEMFPAPIELKCDPAGPSREPDLLFVAKAYSQRIGEKRIDGPADLVIEVVSDDSVARDYDEKFIEYQECGVSEYWIIDPRERRKRALFYQLSDAALLEAVMPGEGGIYRSKVVPGFWLKVAWLWELPDPQLTFGEIAGFSQKTMADLRAMKQSEA